jgi:rhodanese-related sulfurtransferase
MKKRILLAALAITTLMLVACTPKGETSTTKNTTNASQSTYTTVANKPAMPTELNPASLPRPEVARVSADELLQFINTKADVVIVDTRSKDEYANGHIKGAVNVPSFPPGAPLLAQLKTLPVGKILVFYCAWNDDGDAANIAFAMAGLTDSENKPLGFNASQMKALRGGYKWWIQLGYPIEKTN